MDFDLNRLTPLELEIIAKIEVFAQDFAKADAVELLSDTIKIPVVVHVVHNTKEQNISKAQVISQIVALNKDYQRQNSDAGNVPPEFLPDAANTKIEFALAVRNPNGMRTTGITSTNTTQTRFIEPQNDPLGSTDQPIKHSDQGGHDPWPTDKYLNIWICNLFYHKSDGTLGHSSGYSQFPGGNPAHDGVVINYDSFGTVGNRIPHRELGRTATHEIGHWLNLRHIWGRAGTCPETAGTFDDDGINDTPAQKSPNEGCPTFPSTQQSCLGTGPNGTMFMNYMDYTHDECMCMFTTGQAVRMRATLKSYRRSILTSDGLEPITVFADR